MQAFLEIKELMRKIIYIVLIGIFLINCGGREYAEMQKRLHQLNEYNKGDWCFFDGKIGVSARFNNVVLAAGYSYSTLDVYGMRRKLKYDNQKFSAFYPQHHDTHGAFLSISLFI